MWVSTSEQALRSGGREGSLIFGPWWVPRCKHPDNSQFQPTNITSLNVELGRNTNKQFFLASPMWASTITQLIISDYFSLFKHTNIWNCLVSLSVCSFWFCFCVMCSELQKARGRICLQLLWLSHWPTQSRHTVNPGWRNKCTMPGTYEHYLHTLTVTRWMGPAILIRINGQEMEAKTK